MRLSPTCPYLIFFACAALSLGSEPVDDAEWWRLEALRCEYDARRQLYEMRLERREADAAEFITANHLAQELRVRATEERNRKAELEATVADLRRTLASHKAAWIKQQRSHQRGRKLDLLAGPGGRNYRDVTISEVTDAGVEFQHATGSARLTASQLTRPQREEFGIDPLDAEEFLKRESNQRAAYHEAVDRAEAAEAAAADARRATRERAEAASRPPTTRTPTVYPAPPTGALSQPPRRLGRRADRFYESGGTHHVIFWRSRGSQAAPCPPAVLPRARSAKSPEHRTPIPFTPQTTP